MYPLSAGGVEPPTKFPKKGGSLTRPQLLEGCCWERGRVTFSGGSCNFHIKKKDPTFRGGGSQKNNIEEALLKKVALDSLLI